MDMNKWTLALNILKPREIKIFTVLTKKFLSANVMVYLKHHLKEDLWFPILNSMETHIRKIILYCYKLLWIYI